MHCGRAEEKEEEEEEEKGEEEEASGRAVSGRAPSVKLRHSERKASRVLAQTESAARTPSRAGRTLFSSQHSAAATAASAAAARLRASVEEGIFAKRRVGKTYEDGCVNAEVW
jgi:hypothetical protein